MAHGVWIRELRAPFLLLPVVFVPVGLATAWFHGHLDLPSALLTLAGVLCLHASVNVLNDYFDFRSGIDLATSPTPFSGGSTILPRQLMAPREVFFLGSLLLAAGVGMGSYFVYEFSFDPFLIAILGFAAFSIVSYSPLTSKLGVGELVTGLNFGPLLLLGTYYIQTRQLSVEPFVAGIPLGVLTAGILYVNEFPDTDADRSKGRNHLVVRWGKPKAAAMLKVMLALTYVSIIAAVAARIVIPFALIALASLPKALTTSRLVSKNYDKVNEMIPGMASMVMTTLLTGSLLFVAYLAAGLL